MNSKLEVVRWCIEEDFSSNSINSVFMPLVIGSLFIVLEDY